MLNKYEYGSVFGHTKTETAVTEISQKSSHSSSLSSSSSKWLDAEAELAAKREQAKAVKDIQAQQSRLNKLESEFILEKVAMLAEMEQKKAERRLKLEEQSQSSNKQRRKSK